jgi:hypothetical protein
LLIPATRTNAALTDINLKELPGTLERHEFLGSWGIGFTTRHDEASLKQRSSKLSC